MISLKTPIIIDVEASGFGKGSYPIEVGLIDDAGQTWCSLIRPQPDWQHWDPSAESVHHISRDILKQYGKECGVVADYLNQLLGGMVVYSDGWAQDFVWISRLFDAADRTPNFRIEDLRYVLTPEQEAQWHATKTHVIDDMNATRHRASIDAKVIQLTWLNTRV